MLAKIRQGRGRLSACASLGISERQLENTIAALPRFRIELQAAGEVALETLAEIAYDEASKTGAKDIPLLIFLLKRHDQAKQLAQARQDRLDLQARREAEAGKGAVAAAVHAAVSLLLADIPAEKVPGVLAKIDHLLMDPTRDPPETSAASG